MSSAVATTCDDGEDRLETASAIGGEIETLVGHLPRHMWTSLVKTAYGYRPAPTGSRSGASSCGARSEAEFSDISGTTYTGSSGITTPSDSRRGPPQGTSVDVLAPFDPRSSSTKSTPLAIEKSQAGHESWQTGSLMTAAEYSTMERFHADRQRYLHGHR